jgi:hypothetical protein
MPYRREHEARLGFASNRRRRALLSQARMAGCSPKTGAGVAVLLAGAQRLSFARPLRPAELRHICHCLAIAQKPGAVAAISCAHQFGAGLRRANGKRWRCWQCPGASLLHPATRGTCTPRERLAPKHPGGQFSFWRTRKRRASPHVVREARRHQLSAAWPNSPTARVPRLQVPIG